MAEKAGAELKQLGEGELDLDLGGSVVLVEWAPNDPEVRPGPAFPSPAKRSPSRGTGVRAQAAH